MNQPPEMFQALLSHVSLRTPEPERSATFYERIVGLTVHERLEGGAIRLGFGRGDHVLELRPGPTGLDHYALELTDGQAQASLLDRLRAAGVELEQEQPDGAHPAVASFADPNGHRVEVHGAIDRSGEASGQPGRRPVRLHHLTVASPQIHDLEAFYTEVVGFRVSDRMGDAFVWMRCNPEHHTLAAVTGPAAAMDHYCYELAEWADFKTWCDNLAAQDVPVTWGPGRHGPGNNLFIMFDDLDGNHIELSAEMERFYDDRVDYASRRWEQSPKTVNLWGPIPAWREGPTRR